MTSCKVCCCHRSCRPADDSFGGCGESPVGQDERRGTSRRQRHARLHGATGRLYRRRAPDAVALLRPPRCRRPRSSSSPRVGAAEMDDRRQRRGEVAVRRAASLRRQDDGRRPTSGRPAPTYRRGAPAWPAVTAHPPACRIYHQPDVTNAFTTREFLTTEAHAVTN